MSRIIKGLFLIEFQQEPRTSLIPLVGEEGTISGCLHTATAKHTPNASALAPSGESMTPSLISWMTLGKFLQNTVLTQSTDEYPATLVCGWARLTCTTWGWFSPWQCQSQWQFAYVIPVIAMTGTWGVSCLDPSNVMIYNKKCIFGLYTHFWHRAPKALRISSVIRAAKVSLVMVIRWPLAFIVEGCWRTNCVIRRSELPFHSSPILGGEDRSWRLNPPPVTTFNQSCLSKKAYKNPKERGL